MLKLWLWLLFVLGLCCAEQLPLSSINPDGFDQGRHCQGCSLWLFVYEPCKALHGELLIAAQNLSKTSDVAIYEIDCAEHAKFCASLDVLSFPTLRVFDHQQWSRYRGQQKASPIVTHVLKRVMEPFVELDEQQLSVMRNLDLPLMVLTCSHDDEASIGMLSSLAENELSQNFFVGVTPSSQIDQKITPFVTVSNILDETTPKYDGPFEREGLATFANLVSKPLVRQFDLSAIVSFMKSGLPIAMIYAAQEEERKSIAQFLSVVAMKYRDKINFATVDAVKNAFSLEPLGLKADQLPAFVIQTDNDVFNFSPASEITPEAIDDFIQKSLYPQKFQAAYPTA